MILSIVFYNYINIDDFVDYTRQNLYILKYKLYIKKSLGIAL